MEKRKILMMVRIAIVTAIYAALTVIMSQYSYLGIQLRIAELLILLVIYKKEYSISLILGCFIANLFSPLGIYDVIFGTLATALAVLCMFITKNKLIASLFPVIINALIVGAELYYILDLPFWLSALQVAIGEFIVVTVIGVPVFKLLEHNAVFKRIFGIDDKKEIIEIDTKED